MTGRLWLHTYGNIKKVQLRNVNREDEKSCYSSFPGKRVTLIAPLTFAKWLENGGMIHIKRRCRLSPLCNSFDVLPG